LGRDKTNKKTPQKNEDKRDNSKAQKAPQAFPPPETDFVTPVNIASNNIRGEISNDNQVKVSSPVPISTNVDLFKPSTPISQPSNLSDDFFSQPLYNDTPEQIRHKPLAENLPSTFESKNTGDDFFKPPTSDGHVSPFPNEPTAFPSPNEPTAFPPPADDFFSKSLYDD